jgi:hypothetical protein
MEEDEVLHKQLDRSLQAMLSSDQTAWTMFSIFWAANAVPLDALHGADRNYSYGAAIALTGTFGSVVWWVVQHRGLLHQGAREDIVARLERRLVARFGEMYCISYELNPAYKAELTASIGARPWMEMSPAVMAFFWSAL